MKRNESFEKHIAWRKAHYEQEDVNGRLVINLRDIGHTMRDMSEGRGSQKRILTVLLETGCQRGDRQAGKCRAAYPNRE